MQIVCPNCSARYLVDPAAIGRQGRTVQCFRCGHKWMAHVEPDVSEAPAEALLTDTRPVPDFVIRPQNRDEPISLPTVPPERGMPIWLKISLGLLILIGVVGGVGYALRDQLAVSPSRGPVPAPSGPATKPPTPPAAPTKPSSPSPGAPALMLEKDNVESVAGAGRSIIVSGAIVNTSTVEVAPRRIRLTFKDKDRQSVGEKVFELKPDRIAPLGQQPFRQRIDDPPAGAVDIVVEVEPLS